MPDNPLISNVNTADSVLQKQGHGSLVCTPGGEWYYVSLTGRPLNHPNESSHDPRGWSPLGRETALQKVYWDEDLWPRIVGGQDGLLEIDGPVEYADDSPQEGHSLHDEFNESTLDINWNTLRVPFGREMGRVGNGSLTLIGKGSLANEHDLSLVARRWQAFRFDAETKVKFNPKTYQAMAGLTNYYNSRHWSFIFVTYDEKKKTRVIEVAENNQGRYTSYLKDNSIPIPDNVEYVYLRTRVRDLDYIYQYSFDGKDWKDTGVHLDSAVLSDEYVLSSYGGFFTGAFVGMAAVDYSGYDAVAEFGYFDYSEVFI
jgi:xylan 1,4-beta-xylosidase